MCGVERPGEKPEVSEEDALALIVVNASREAGRQAHVGSLSCCSGPVVAAARFVARRARELLGKEAAKLRKELESARTERDDGLLRLGDCRRARAGLEAEIAEHKQRLADHEASRRVRLEEAAALQRRIAELAVETEKLRAERDAARVERTEARGLLDAKIAECEEMKRKLETEKQRRAGYEKEVGELAKFLLWDYSLISWSMILSPCQRAIQVIRELHEDRRQGDVSGLPAVGDTVEIGRPMPLPSFGDSQAWTYVGYTSVVEAPSMMLATGKVFLADEGKQWRRRVQPSSAPTPDGADDTAAVCPGCRRLGVCAIHDGRGHKGTMGEAGSALPTTATPPAESTAGELPKMARLGLALVTSTGIDPEFREACMKLARLDAIDYAEAVTRELKQAARPSPSACPRCGMTFITGFTCMCGRTR
jgi:hypothetical protein